MYFDVEYAKNGDVSLNACAEAHSVPKQATSRRSFIIVKVVDKSRCLDLNNE